MSRNVRPFLLWDHDGVLVDTERWYFEATRQVLARLGVELSAPRYLELMARGRSSWDLARQVGIPEEEIGLRRAERDELYREFLRTKPLDIPGVSEVLADLSCRHRMAIITTARRSDFELIQAGRDLMRHFEFALTLEDCVRAKPHPDPYRAGLARFGARPEHALAIEDSARGLASARAAGLDCVVVRNSFTEAQDFRAAWRVVDTVRELPRLLSGELGRGLGEAPCRPRGTEARA